MKNDLNFVNIGVLEIFFFCKSLIITISFFYSPPTSSRFHPLQVENCDSNSRLVVDEDDNGKFRIERVNGGIVELRLKL